MSYFDVQGYGKSTVRKRTRRYFGRTKEEAINAAAADGTLVETINEVPDAAPVAEPATDRQISYARSLGLSFPPDITMREMSDLLSRHLDGDGPPSEVLRMYAESQGLVVSRYIGKNKLLRMLGASFSSRGDQQYAEWFVYHVWKELAAERWDAPTSSALPQHAAMQVASALAADERMMKSIRRYDPAEFYDFGVNTDADGYTEEGGSKSTIAYREAAMMLKNLTGLDRQVGRRNAYREPRHEPARSSTRGCLLVAFVFLAATTLVIGFAVAP